MTDFSRYRERICWYVGIRTLLIVMKLRTSANLMAEVILIIFERKFNSMYEKVSTDLNLVQREKQVEKFWKDHDILKKA